MSNTGSTTTKRRLFRYGVIATLMGVSFTLGVAVTAVATLPIIAGLAAQSAGMQIIGMISASSSATMAVLNSGDSASRFTVLTQLKQVFESPELQKIDPQVAAIILPAVEQCKADSDPEVVELASELIKMIEDNTVVSSQ